MLFADFTLERFFAKYEFSARYLLCSSDAEAVTIADLLSAANQSVEPLLSLPLSYVESTGSLGLRTAIATATGPQITPSDVLVCAGGQDAVLCALVGLLKPNDHVVAVMPTYQSLEEIPRGLGAKIEHVWLRPENQFRFDVNEILHRVSDRTKLVTLVNPHNPTGACLSRREMEQLCAGLARTGTYLLCDELYRDLVDDSAPCAAQLYDRAISVGGLAKSFGLAGLRIGWMVTRDHALLARAASFKDYTSICHTAHGDWLATLALTDAKEVLVKRTRALVQDNRTTMAEFLSRYPSLLRWMHPHPNAPTQSTISLVELLGTETSAAFCERVVQSTGVLLMPGELFELPRFVRIGLGRKALSTTLSALAPALS